jgi:hypothetical protein
MGLGASAIPAETVELGAKRYPRDHRLRSNHQASRHRQRTLVGHRSPRLRSIWPTRYAHRRPLGIFDALFGW